MKKSLNELEKKQFAYLLRVVSSAINGEKTPLPYKNINWTNMINLANLCGFSSMFASSIQKIGAAACISPDILKTFKEIEGKQILIDSVLDYEIENVLKAFEKYHIKNVPLKGYFLKDEYPRSDFRTVSDFDILFDEEQINTVKTAFFELGYSFVKSYDNQYHFQKLPYTYIEMHTNLVHKNEFYFPLLKNQINKTIKRSGYEYSFKMTDEDHYLYMLIHDSNHFRTGGFGIRMLLDIYLFNKHHRSTMDENYISEYLKLYKLEKFEKLMRETGERWFGNSTPEILFNDFEIYILLSCTLGRLDAAILIESQKAINKSSKSKSKFIYLFKSIFPPFETYKYHSPYVEKYPFLAPFAWGSMWYRRFFVDKNVNIKRGVKNRMSYSDDDVIYISNLLKQAGFDDF